MSMARDWRLLTTARLASRDAPHRGAVPEHLLLETGEIQIGFVTQGVATAWNSGGVATGGRPVRAMRAMFPMYDTPFQFVALQNTGIQSLTDLGGKRVGVGPEGGTGGIYAPRLFRTWAIDAQLVHGDWNDLAAQLIEGKIDALAVAAGVPFPAMAHIERSAKFSMFLLRKIRSLRRVSRYQNLAPRSLPPAAIHRCASTTRPWGFSISPWSAATCPTIWSTLSSKRFSRTTTA